MHIVRSMIYFTKYAIKKFQILKEHQIDWSKQDIEQTVLYPDKIKEKGRNMAAQKGNMKVVFKQEGETKKIITFYPV